MKMIGWKPLLIKGNTFEKLKKLKEKEKKTYDEMINTLIDFYKAKSNITETIDKDKTSETSENE